MTDLAHALAAKLLNPFEGYEVTSAGMELPGAAGGLRDALAFAPIEFHRGDDVYIVFRCTPKRLRFDPIKDSDAWQRVHIMEILETALVDEVDVRDLLAKQRDRIKLLKEEAAGIQRLALDADLAEQEAAAMAEEATEEGRTDDDGYYDPAPAPTDISTASPRKRGPKKAQP